MIYGMVLFLNLHTATAADIRCANVLASMTSESTAATPSSVKANTSALEILKNEKIVAKNKFTTSRSLQEYIGFFSFKDGNTLKQPLFEKLQSLKSSDRWLDSGAGRAYAQKTFLKSFKDKQDAPELIAMSYKKPLFVWPVFSKKFQYIEGKWLEEIPTSELKKFNLITDIYGPISYSKNPISILNKYLDLLEVGGEAYFLLVSRNNLIDMNGHVVSLGEWLIDVSKNQNDFVIEKLSFNEFRIRLNRPTEFRWHELELKNFFADLPPFRRFAEPNY